MALGIAAGSAALSALDNWASNFFNQHSSQSAQTYSAAVARDLGLMNQYFTAQNMEYSKILQSMLNSEAYGYNRSLASQQFDYEKALAALQNEYQQGLAATSFAYDAELAKVSQALNKLSADQDYNRSVRYIKDSLLRYKDALIQAGYNPLLALGSSAANYSGHTNGTSLGSVSAGSAGMGSVGLGSVSSGHVSGGSPASSSGVGVVSAHGSSSALAQSIQAGISLAKEASEIKSNEASAQRDSASAVESLERAKTEANQRTDTGHKIQSETAKNYGQIATGVATGIGTAYGANKAAKVAKSVINSTKLGQTATAVRTAANEIGASATSAHLGSRILGSVVPMAAGASIAIPASFYGAKEAAKRADKNGDQRETKYFFPGSTFY